VLSSSLQRIVTKVADTFNACDDPKINVDDRYNRIGELGDLTADVDQLVMLLQEELASGAAQDALRDELEQKMRGIQQCAAELRQLLPRYDPHSVDRGDTAKRIFDDLLKIVDATIDLLKSSDRSAIEKIIRDAERVLAACNLVTQSSTPSDLVVSAGDFSSASVALVKRFTRRLKVIPTDAQPRGDAALKTLKEGTPRFIAAQRAAISGDYGSPELSHARQAVETAIQEVMEVARVAPEFSVNFEVDYYDDQLGHDMIALSDAIFRGDEPAAVEHTKKVVGEVKNRVQNGREIADTYPADKKRNILESCDRAEDGLADIVRNARDALKARLANPNSQPGVEYFQAERKLNDAMKKVKQSVDEIPAERRFVAQTERYALLDAARKMVMNFDQLLKK